MATTEILGLSVTPEDEYTTTTFLQWRLKQIGDLATSNPIILNNWAEELSGSIADYSNSKLYNVYGYGGPSVYVSTGSSADGITGYTDGMFIVLTLESDPSGSPTIDIGGAGSSLLCDSFQTAIPITSRSVQSNTPYFFEYVSSGSIWRLMQSSSSAVLTGKGVYLGGANEGEIITIENNALFGSGSTLQDLLTQRNDIRTANFITLTPNSSLPNSGALTGGSGVGLILNQETNTIKLYVPEGSITGGMIELNSITGEKIAFGAIENEHIEDENISGSVVNAPLEFEILPSSYNTTQDYRGIYLQKDVDVTVHERWRVPSNARLGNFGGQTYKLGITGLFYCVAGVSGSATIEIEYRHAQVDEPTFLTGSFVNTVSTTGLLYNTVKTSGSSNEIGAYPEDCIYLKMHKPDDATVDLWFQGFMVSYYRA